MSRVLVVGAGLSGLGCALRLADGGVPVTVIAAGVGSLQLGGATIDVLGYAPGRVERPLDSLTSLGDDHPYSLLGPARVEAAATWLAGRLPALGLRGSAAENMLLATAVGAARPTAVAPAAVAAGDLRRGGPVSFASVGGQSPGLVPPPATTTSFAAWAAPDQSTRTASAVLIRPSIPRAP